MKSRRRIRSLALISERTATMPMSRLLYPVAYLLSRVCDSTITTKAKSPFSTEKIRLCASNGDLRSRGSIALLVPQPGQKTSSQGCRRGA
jgi:hypothetical protein